MSHGKYEIKVVHVQQGELFSYTGATHPQEGEYLTTQSGVRYCVSTVEHVLKGYGYGSEEAFYLDYVVVEVV